MKLLLETEERHVVPRWRISAKALGTGELNALSTQAVQLLAPSEDLLLSRLEEWGQSRELGVATDLVGAALVLGLESKVLEPAEFLLKNADRVPEPALKIARRIAGQETESERSDKHEGHVASLRRHLKVYPRNPVAWLDLALSYAALGHREKAAQAVRASLSIAPESRFVLRGAARFYVHVHDPERAQHLLEQSSSIRKDPWLIAAEIAASDVAGKTSTLLRKGRSMLSAGDFSAAETSELASAVASLELAAGNDRAARKLFRQALVEPTDNTLAQAEWAARKLVTLEVPSHLLERPLSFEARTIDSYLRGSWSRALTEAKAWQHDEPYSTRPPILASFITSVILEDYVAGERLIREGLRANPSNPVLLNNLAFSLASRGCVEDAEKAFQRVRTQHFGSDESIALTATSGLIKFRKGLTESGREDYLEATRLARVAGNPYYEAMAASFLIREELLAGTAKESVALEVATRAMACLPPRERQVIELLLGRVAGGGSAVSTTRALALHK